MSQIGTFPTTPQRDPGAEPLVRGSQGETETPARSRGKAQRDPGAEPLLRGQGEAPLKLKALKHLHIYKESPKIC